MKRSQITELEGSGTCRKKSTPLSNRVTAEIRELILNGELQPGARIGQEALAERFGTSRI